MVSQQLADLVSSVRWQDVFLKERNQIKLIDLFSSLVPVILCRYHLGQDFLLTWRWGQHSPFFIEVPGRKKMGWWFIFAFEHPWVQPGSHQYQGHWVFHPATHSSEDSTRIRICIVHCYLGPNLYVNQPITGSQSLETGNCWTILWNKVPFMMS